MQMKCKYPLSLTHLALVKPLARVGKISFHPIKIFNWKHKTFTVFHALNIINPACHVLLVICINWNLALILQINHQLGVVNHDVFKTEVLKNPRFVARMSDWFDRINNRKHAFFSVYHKCRYTFCLKEEIIRDVSFLINILLLSHQLWLESGSQPAEKLFASDFLKQSILFERFFVDVLT